MKFRCRQNFFDVRPFDAVADEKYVQFALGQPFHIGLGQLAQGLGKDFRTVPMAKGANEGGDHGIGWNIKTLTGHGDVIRREPIGVEDGRIDAVGISEDALRIDATGNQFVTQNIRNGDDQMSVTETGLFRLYRQFLKGQRPAPVVGKPRFRAVVFHDQR